MASSGYSNFSHIDTFMPIMPFMNVIWIYDYFGDNFEINHEFQRGEFWTHSNLDISISVTNNV